MSIKICYRSSFLTCFLNAVKFTTNLEVANIEVNCVTSC